MRNWDPASQPWLLPVPPSESPGVTEGVSLSSSGSLSSVGALIPLLQDAKPGGTLGHGDLAVLLLEAELKGESSVVQHREAVMLSPSAPWAGHGARRGGGTK